MLDLFIALTLATAAIMYSLELYHRNTIPHWVKYSKQMEIKERKYRRMRQNKHMF